MRLLPFAQFHQGPFPVVLLQPAVVHVVHQAVPGQQVTDAFHGLAVVAEYQRGLVADPAQQPEQGFEFVVALRNHFFKRKPGRQGVGEEIQPCRPGQAHEGRNLRHAGGRGQGAPPQARQLAHDKCHVRLETQFQRFVEFIEYQPPHRSRVECAAAQVVGHPSRCPDKHGRRLAEAVGFGCKGVAAVKTIYLEWPAQLPENLVDLQGQFPGRRQDQGLNAACPRHQPFGQGQQESQRFARAGRRYQHHILVRPVRRQRRLLHGVSGPQCPAVRGS
jgi:hypothetical protein